jgi:Tol biopolymer transport system component
VWSPDGRHLVYSDGAAKISIKATDGASDARVLLSLEHGARLLPDSFSPDGSVLAYNGLVGKNRDDIWMIPTKGDGKPYPFMATPASEWDAAFSPDGKWVAYLSDESGKIELFVVPFPGPGGKWQISSGGAQYGFWVGDGHEIAYATPQQKLIGVQVNAKGANLEIGASHTLFGGQSLPADRGAISPDGHRYLAPVPLEEATASPLTLVTNWQAELKRK